MFGHGGVAFVRTVVAVTVGVGVGVTVGAGVGATEGLEVNDGVTGLGGWIIGLGGRITWPSPEGRPIGLGGRMTMPSPLLSGDRGG